MQLTAGAKLREMERNWGSLVSKNYDIEWTNVQLENEIYQLSSKRERQTKKTSGKTSEKTNLLGRKEEKLGSHKHQPSKLL